MHKHHEHIKQAIRMLDAAIARHERHMAGREATSDASQRKLMEEIKKARSLLPDMDM